MEKAAEIPSGVWPTMITPFTESGAIDERALHELVAWYLERGVSGLFAVCLSSEMFTLTPAERVKLASTIVDLAAGRVPVIASAVGSGEIEKQAEEVRRMADTGVDAVVLLTNRLALPDESDDAWRSNTERLLEELQDDIVLGLYECPVPYKRVLSPELLAWCAETGRFVFLKDTCCNVALMRAKMKAAPEIHLFNANATTLLASLLDGAAGYSGVMANFHPQLYGWLCHNWATEPEHAEQLQAFLGIASLLELRGYPVNAKYALQLEGLPISLYSRARSEVILEAWHQLQIEQVQQLAHTMAQSYPWPR